MGKIELRGDETMAFEVEDGRAHIVVFDPDAFEPWLVEYFSDSGDLEIIYEEELVKYDNEGWCTLVFTEAFTVTEPGGWTTDGFVIASVALVAGEVTRVARM